MRHSFLARVFAALLAAWFTINVVDPARLHACPVHDGAAAQAHDTGHGAHAHHGSQEHSRAPESHQCHCFGSCCAATPVAASRAPELATAEVTVVAPGLPDYAYVVVARSHLLPFANGPPAA
jgi:hypothetical protein